MRHLLATVMIGAIAPAAFAEPATPLKVHEPGVTIELFAEHPQIVTPTGIEVDRRGRVYCIENHTHQRPKDYQGPEHDRLQVYEDTDNDGRADRVTTFHDGFTHGMDLAFSPDGALYLATRSDIYRLADTNGDGKADDVKLIVKLETATDYPHNGLSGLAFDGDGGFYFGLGENRGAPYRLLGTDDSEASGADEGGSVYHVQTDGTKLRRVATGFWNPWGMCIDNFGNVFATDNDPGSAPPSRLLHIVEGGDYGFEMRYGGDGLHPFQTRDGELPGTLPMVAGTGEAPCEIIPLPNGDLLVASWADHRIERYTLKPRGVSFAADRAIVISGGNDFRPVGIALAPDGSYYVSDWVEGSYPVHGKGRIWRMKLPEMTSTKVEPKSHRVGGGVWTPLWHKDPFVRQAARNRQEFSIPILFRILDTAQERKEEIAVAIRRSPGVDAADVIPRLMSSRDPGVRLVALKWIADEKLTRFRFPVEQGLNDANLTLPLFMAHLATLERLDLAEDGKVKRQQPDPDLLLAKVFDEAAPPLIRAYSLRLLPPDMGRLKVAKLMPLVSHDDALLRLEAVRTIRYGNDPERVDALARIAGDEARDAAVRAEAIAGLAGSAGHADLLAKLAASENAAIRDEALRSLLGVPLNDAHRLQLNQGAPTPATTRVMGFGPELRPAPESIDAWVGIVEAGEGNPAAGERIFFGKTIGTCGNCHTFGGRGVRVGPDLSMMGKRADARHLLESMLQPGKEIAPQYLPWLLHLKGRETKLGIGMRKGGNQEIYLGLDGKEFSVKLDQLESREELPTSLMPPALPLMMTDQELRDLIAFLLQQ